jgi:hypothetical protein
VTGPVVIRAVQPLRRGALLALLVEAGEPSREPLHRSLELRMEVDEGAQLISQPGESDLIVSPTCLELLDTPIGEVHTFTMLGSRTARESWCRDRSRAAGLGRAYARGRVPSSTDAKAASIRARCCCR